MRAAWNHFACCFVRCLFSACSSNEKSNLKDTNFKLWGFLGYQKCFDVFSSLYLPLLHIWLLLRAEDSHFGILDAMADTQFRCGNAECQEWLHNSFKHRKARNKKGLTTEGYFLHTVFIGNQIQIENIRAPFLHPLAVSIYRFAHITTVLR